METRSPSWTRWDALALSRSASLRVSSAVASAMKLLDELEAAEDLGGRRGPRTGHTALAHATMALESLRKASGDLSQINASLKDG